ncbi:nucleoside/nucleotide kinase family protein [Diplocloster modestus]|uniref:Uridine kinase n=1 Tax=Diplocloster modestus TaxID=2850322 RepID=A0ABS6K9P4_9FIRM|nr:hypothetical protein [Diplocloster modestus]MBU9727228.1 hypothetical protein [Diplocloster modestus]
MADHHELSNILIRQYRNYPCLELQDLIKLIYQNEFGGGHMIQNESEAFVRLKKEWEQNHKSGAPKPMSAGAADTSQDTGHGYYESIGNGLCRLYLNEQIPVTLLSCIHRMFCRTANTVNGSISSFEEKCLVLQHCCSRGDLPFSEDEYHSYMNTYREMGYPVLSHSTVYHAAYRPAYRIVYEVYGYYLSVIGRIAKLLSEQEYVTVVIDGRCASGKSTLAELLSSVFDAAVIHMDDFFLQAQQRTEKRLEEPGGNIDYERFYAETAEGLLCHREFTYQKFQCATMTLEDYIKVPLKPLRIVEGAYSLHPGCCLKPDFKIFLDVSKDAQSRCILQRNGPHMHRRFLQEWIPMENRYFEYYGIKEDCHMVLDNSEVISVNQDNHTKFQFL